MKCPSSRFPILALFSFLACAPFLLAQDELKFNVPYACNDGVTYVVHKCLVSRRVKCATTRPKDSPSATTRAPPSSIR